MIRFETGNTDDFGRVHLFEIHDSEFSGSPTTLKGTGQGYASFSNQVIDPKQPYTVQKSALELSVYVDDLSFIDDLKESDERRFHIVHKIDGDQQWVGYVYNDLCTYEENIAPFGLTLVAKDFTDLDSKDYLVDGELPDDRETVISTLGYILSQIGFNVPIKTHTSWIQDNINSAQDYLRQIFHETSALSVFGQSVQEGQRSITLLKALEDICESHKLIITQRDGAYWIDQLTAYEDAEDVFESVYDFEGNFQSEGDRDLSATAKVVIAQGNRDNSHSPGVKRVVSTFNHRSLLAATKNIGLVEFDDETVPQVFRININSDGNQSASIRASIFSSFNGQPENPRVLISLNLIERFTADLIKSYNFSTGEWQDEATNRVIPLTITLAPDPGSPITTHVAEGEISIVTPTMPDDVDGRLSWTIRRAFADDDFVADITEYRDTFMAILDSNLNSSETFQLTQDGNFSTALEGQFIFGDGPVTYAPSALRFSDDDDDVTTSVGAFGSWGRRGGTANRSFAYNHLSELMFVRRGFRRLLTGLIKGEYKPHQVLQYDGAEFYNLGGTWDIFTGNYTANLFEINVEDDEDTFEEFVEPSNVRSAPGGGTSGGGGGISQSTADARYFRQSNNLSEGNPSTIRDNIDVFSKSESDGRFFRISENLSEGVPATMRSNLELGTAALREANQDLRTTDSVEFASVEADGIIVEDGIRKNTSDIITNFLRGEHLSVQKVDLFSDATLNTLSLTEQATEEDQAVRADRDIIAGDGLTGGGNLTGDVTLNVDVDDATIEIDGDLRVKDAGITEPKVADDAISTPKIQDDAITTGKILDGNVTNVKLANSTISGKELGTNLDSLSTGTGMTGDAYNGSASREFSTVPATPSQAGHVSTGSQSFGGDKTFKDDIEYRGVIESENFADVEDFYTGAELSQDTLKIEVIRANELRVKAFVAEISAALYGEDVLTKSRGVLSRDFTVPAVSSTSKLFVEDLEGFVGTPVFEDGDFIRMRIVDRSGGLQVADVWGNVTGYNDEGDGEQSWDFERIAGGTATTGDTIFTGSIAIDYGQSGDGVIIRSVIGDNSPRDTVLTWETSPISPANFTVLTRTGNLNGTFGVTTDRFGFGAKDNVVIEVGDNDTLTLGKDAGGAGLHGININANNFWYGTGEFKVGSSDKFLEFDGSDLTASLDSLSIEAVGDVGSSVLSLESDVIQLGLQSENSYSGIEFLSGRTIISALDDGRLVSLDLDATPDEGGVFTVRSNFFDWESDDIVVRGGFGDPATAKIILGDDAVNQGLTSDNGEGVYIDGNGNFRFGVLDGNGALEKGILFDGTDLEIATEKLLVDTGGGFSNADFFLDSEEHQLSLGDVFSVDGGTNEGEIAGWLARTDGFYDSANLGLVRNKNLDVFLGSFDGSRISDNFRGLYLDESNYFMRFESSGDRVFQIGEEDEFMFYRTGVGLRIQGDITANEGRFLGDIIVEGDGKITNESTYEIDENGIRMIPSSFSSPNNALLWSGSNTNAFIQGLTTTDPGIATFTGENGFFRYTRGSIIQFQVDENGFNMQNPVGVRFVDSSLGNEGTTEAGHIEVVVGEQTRYIKLYE